VDVVENVAGPERRILLVEDDVRIGESLRRALDASGYRTLWASDAAAGEAAFHAAIAQATRFDLVLLDLGLPDADGLDVCRRLVAVDPLVPIIMLTARGEELDLVVGLDAGAIDYITKPFSLANVLARLRAQLRRIPAAQQESASGTTTVGDVSINTRTRKAWIADTEVALRAKEFDLLARLMRDDGTVVRRETLMSDVWDENWFGSTKTLDFHVAALRAKLDGGRSVSRISTVRGVGFRYER
jgi:DNA-binding response OmpR family regulator